MSIGSLQSIAAVGVSHLAGEPIVIARFEKRNERWRMIIASDNYSTELGFPITLQAIRDKSDEFTPHSPGVSRVSVESAACMAMANIPANCDLGRLARETKVV